MKNLNCNFIFIPLIFISILFQKTNAQWVQMSNGIGTNQEIEFIASSGNTLFAGTYYQGIYRSTDNGGNWVQSGLNNLDVYTIAVSGSNIFAGTEGSGVFLSTNNGVNWNAMNNGLTNHFVNVITISGINIFVGTVYSPPYGGVYLSTNNGVSWIATGLTDYYVRAFAISGNNIFAGTEPNGIFLSTNNGGNWIAVNNGLPNNADVISLLINGTNIFAGTFPGVFLSTNNGVSWSSSGLSSQIIYSLASIGQNILAGTDTGVFLSTNNGAVWLNKNQGFNTIPHIISLLIMNNFIFAGTTNQSIWRRDLAETIGIQKVSHYIPSSFSLEQNYPNPFNPSTIINYQLPKSSEVKLIVYDIMGQEVRTLVNERQNAGTYNVQFDGTNLASGTYFYTIKADNFTETKRMLLIK